MRDGDKGVGRGGGCTGDGKRGQKSTWEERRQLQSS